MDYCEFILTFFLNHKVILESFIHFNIKLKISPLTFNLLPNELKHIITISEKLMLHNSIYYDKKF